MKTFKKIFLFIIIIFSLLAITGCSKKEELTIEDKIEAEIKYVKNGTKGFLKRCEEDYSGVEATDWNSINSDNINFIQSIETIQNDLNYVKLDQERITQIKNTVSNINNNIKSQNLENTKKEYANLYILFEDLSTENFKTIKKLAMQIYINSISKNDIVLSDLITKIENEYANTKPTKDNYIVLNRCNDVIYSFKNLLKENNFDEIRINCLNIVELL